MRLAEILALTGATKKTLYRWMEKHPTVTTADPLSALGHSFPRPCGNQGRAVLWDEEQVRAWWNTNALTVGRHPEAATVTTIPWSRFRVAMLAEPELHVGDRGEEIMEDDLDLIVRFERDGDNAILTFKNVQDAVFFKLKHG